MEIHEKPENIFPKLLNVSNIALFSPCVLVKYWLNVCCENLYFILQWTPGYSSIQGGQEFISND